MNKKDNKIEVSELEVGNVFFVSREWGFCEIEGIIGISFFTGKISFGLKPCDKNKSEKYIEMAFKLNKKVRLQQ